MLAHQKDIELKARICRADSRSSVHPTKPLSVLVAVVFMEAVSMNVVLPLLPFYAEHYGASPEMVTQLFATFSVSTLLISPIVGKLGDRFGLKPVFLLSIFGTSMAFVGLAFAQGMTGLFVWRAVGGAMAANLAVAQAYAARLSSAGSRARAIGQLTAANGAGMAIGPGIGAAIAGIWGAGDFSVPFMIAAGISALTIAVGFVWLSEPARAPASAPPAANDKAAPAAQRARDLTAQGGVSLGFAYLLPLAFGLAFCLNASVAVTALWAERRLGWGPPEVGSLLTAVGTITLVSQGALVGPLVRRFGEVGVLTGACAVLVGSCIAVSFANSSAGASVCFLLLYLAVGLANVSSHALVSLAAKQGEQGAAMGMNLTVRSVARIVSMLVAGVVFARVSPSAPFLLAAAVLLMSAGATFATWHYRTRLLRVRVPRSLP